MSLKDLLPPGTFEEISMQARRGEASSDINAENAASRNACKQVMVRCPTCRKLIPYRADNPFRPFCSERCKLIDLGAWAAEERTIPGDKVNEDTDGDLLSDPSLPKRFTNQKDHE